MSRDWFRYFKEQGIDNFPLFTYYYYTSRQRTVGYIKKFVPQHSSVLEIGCGSALLAILLSAMDYEVLGIDNDSRIVEIARHNNERLEGHARIELMDLFEAPRRLQRVFDLVYSEGVIEHFRGVRLHEAVRVHGELGKKVMITVPSRMDPSVMDQDAYDFKELEDLCYSADLKPIMKFGMSLSNSCTRELVPPVIERLFGRWLDYSGIGIVCSSAHAGKV